MARLRHIICLLLLAAFAPQGLFADRYTVVVSFDGFRDDYTRTFSTPFLDSLARMGVSATMQPSYPSKTFPNHYTIATGLVPDHHGIIANKFLDIASGITFALGQPTSADPRFWGGEPVWNTAARQGVKAGIVYWPGSDVCIGGRYPDYYHNYAHKPLLSYPQRISEVARYLSLPVAERPRLVMLYFDEPDHTGHGRSPYAPETRREVERMDHIAEELYATLQTLPERDSINIIVLSDHGMAPVDTAHVVNINDYVRPEWVERMQLDLPTHIWPSKGCEAKIMDALRRMPHVRAWRKAEVPAYLSYGTNANIGPIVVNPDCGWMIADRGGYKLRVGGMHGYDPTSHDMQVPFRAVGPDFRRGYHKKEVFRNTAISPLLCRLLGISPASCDGSISDVQDMLESR